VSEGKAVFLDHSYSSATPTLHHVFSDHNYSASASPIIQATAGNTGVPVSDSTKVFIPACNSTDASIPESSSTAPAFPVPVVNTVISQDSSTAPVFSGPAGDPDLEDYYQAVRKSGNPSSTPLAAWVLVTIFLLFSINRNATDNVIGEISQLCSLAGIQGNRRNKPYSKRLMIFCLTLAGYSAKAYSYLRSAVNYSIPTVETLRKYRNRVDGSPGFSVAALKMVKRKVAEMSEKSKHLFLSLSCDDMSIRYGIQCILHVYSVIRKNEVLN
jgi:hypothetical protein